MTSDARVTKYRKKPVVIEAMRWDGSIEGPNGADAIERWSSRTACWADSNLETRIFIQTLEGEMRADPGDWIIKGVEGEFYPCKPDIFAATYEPADAASSTRAPEIVRELLEKLKPDPGRMHPVTLRHVCELADLCAQAHSALSSAAQEAERLRALLRRVVKWNDKVEEGGDSNAYLNGEDGDAWEDMRNITADARAALSQQGEGG